MDTPTFTPFDAAPLPDPPDEPDDDPPPQPAITTDIINARQSTRNFFMFCFPLFYYRKI